MKRRNGRRETLEHRETRHRRWKRAGGLNPAHTRLGAQQNERSGAISRDVICRTLAGALSIFQGSPMRETEEHRRLLAGAGGVPWKKWGPYLSERQWGTVREDYSESGDAWNYFSHDQARSRAYRWGEDGLGGFCDDKQLLCFGLALWNERDPHPRGTPVRAHELGGQSRRRREAVLLLRRQHPDALIHEVSVKKR